MSKVFTLVGTPSPALYATLKVVEALSNVLFGEHDLFCANTVAELQTQLANRPLKHPHRSAVLYSDYPREDLSATYAAMGLPLVICADDFLTIAHYSVVSRDYGGVDAARFASMGLVNIEPLISAPPQPSVIVNGASIRLDDLAARLAELYELPLDATALRDLRRALGQEESGDPTLNDYAAKSLPAPGPARAILERHGPLENELLDSLAAQYGPIVQGRRLEALEWPPFALLRPDFPDRLTVGPIELTGPARFIHYGPYFALPLGRWQADLVFEVSGCLSDNQIAIDVVAGTVLSAVKLKLPPQGVYGCDISFDIDTPSNPVEIRLQLLTGAIEGLLMLRSIHLRRVASRKDGDAGVSTPDRGSDVGSRTSQ